MAGISMRALDLRLFYDNLQAVRDNAPGYSLLRIEPEHVFYELQYRLVCGRDLTANL